MFNINSIASQVKHNCNISDAQFWGYYSPCGLLLRMRDLYKAEHNLSATDRVDHKKIGLWIDEREALWEDLEQEGFSKIIIDGTSFSSFALKGINSLLNEKGYVYGAGYGNMMKPAFMLAHLKETYPMGRYRVYIAGLELARDLATTPAMTRGHTILIREDIMRYFFYDRYEDMLAKNCTSALSRAFNEYGILSTTVRQDSGKTFEKRFSDLVREESRTLVYHETGEIAQRRTLGKWWKELLVDFPYSRAELFLRNLKDTLADTCKSGMLAYIIEYQKSGSLHFYIALLRGFRNNIMPDLIPAYEEFLTSGSWDTIDAARKKGFKNALEISHRLRKMYDNGRATPENIEKELMKNCRQ